MTGTTGTVPLADKFTDIGFDTQYQYQGDNYWLTLRGSYIREFQQLDRRQFPTAASNPTNQLNSMKLQASFAYGADNRVVFTGQYFDVWGTTDPTLVRAPILSWRRLARTATAGWPRSLTFRSAPAR